MLTLRKQRETNAATHLAFSCTQSQTSAHRMVLPSVRARSSADGLGHRVSARFLQDPLSQWEDPKEAMSDGPSSGVLYLCTQDGAEISGR